MNKITTLKPGTRGKNVANLQDGLRALVDQGVLALPDAEKQKLLKSLDTESAKNTFGKTTGKLVGLFQEQRRLAANGEVDEPTAKALNTALKQLETVNPVTPSAGQTTFYVEGKVASRISAGVAGLRVRIVDKNVGKDVILATAVTDERGAYQTSFIDTDLKKRGKIKPDLQARVFAGEKFLAASRVRYNASTRETLNVLLDEKAVSALRSEHETLRDSLAPHFKGNLSDLKETDDRQDITYLANKAGWDARAVAIAALADQFSQRTSDAKNGKIDSAFFYALFRAGLPANEDALYQASAKIVNAIWQKALKQGVIPATLEKTLPGVAQRFQQLAAERALDGPALAGVSRLGEMLTVSLGNDEARHKQFAELYTQHRDVPSKFWGAVRSKLGEAAERRLKLDGQLAYLTFNNAPLIKKIHAAGGQGGLPTVLALVEGGYYRAETWRTAINDVPIPPEIPGSTDGVKRNRYAGVLAAQLRFGFPTAVVAQMVKSGETPIAAKVRTKVHAFMAKHQGDFEIGMHPVKQYIARHNLSLEPEVITAITSIQRVYQITPTDDAMNALLKKGVDSAYAVVRYDQKEFVRTFQKEVGGAANARLIHTKSQQVHSAVLNIAVSYLTNGMAPPIGLATKAGQYLSPITIDVEAANAGDIIAYPTLEGLFGEMDYCSCDHCRSILGPAAYLVDLLLFCDRPTNEKENPHTVLLERRPDIQYLPLTCANTNKPLPYIDLVNEILEYYITNNLSLTDYTGHTTESNVAPEELLASPMFVRDAAYTTLAGQFFPPPLPFHRPLENLRRCFTKFEAPLPEVMTALRKNDNLERATATDYGWRDILMEELRLSRTEYRLLTDRTVTLQQLYGYSPSTTEAAVRAGLSEVKAYTRRVGISYEDMIEILKTRFVNPNSILLPKLERLGVPFATLRAFKTGAISDAQFLALLPPGLDPAQYGGDIKAWVKNQANYDRIMSLIVVTNPETPDDPGRFDEMFFRYADPAKINDPLRAFAFIRLIRFIRLWQKLGWTIEQTDLAITALYPANQIPDNASDAVNLERLDAGFLTMLPRFGLVKQVMDTLGLKLHKDLPSLLACFAPIETHGTGALYRRMFLGSGPLAQDAAFADDGYGNFLTNAAQKIMAHAEALRAAFLLTDDEFNLIATSLNYNANTTLNVENISAIYRRGWLARKLRLSVREFLLLTKFTGFDPFAAPDPPSPQILRLIEQVQHLRSMSLKPTQALYLIWNQDISGKSAPDGSATTGFARALRAALAAVESEFALADDPDGQIARARMALVYGTDAADLFFGLLGGTLVTEVPYGHGQPTLPASILHVAPGRLAYDDLRKRLSFTGVLSTTIRDALKTATGATAPFQAAVDALYAENQKVVGPFFARYQELLPLYNAYVASNDPVEKKRSDLLASFLPELKRRRKRQQALQSMGAAAKADAAFTNIILDEPAVLHAAGDTTRPALDDLTALETAGFSAQFFFRNTATGAVDRTSDVEPNLAYMATGDNKLPANPTPGSAISGIWTGYLEAPENGFYNLRIEADGTAAVTLTISGEAVALARNGNVWSNMVPIELRAGTLHAMSLQVERVKDTMTVHWETAGRGREIIPARYLYSATLTDRLRQVYVRFLKAASLTDTLKLDASELAHLATHADYQIGGEAWLNSLPVAESPDNPTSVALRQVLTALLEFARVKAELAPDDTRFLTMLKDPVTAAADTNSLLYTLTRWEQASLTALLTRFGKTPAELAHLETFCRVYDAYTWVKKLGVPASTLIETATNEPDAGTVSDLQAALRARHDESDWLNVLKPINDEMRGLQRDALVAYILHRMRSTPATAQIDTPDKLFEYFLVDVQMEPAMQTSRIRHALSSVQLFIERCLMNLEPRVAPSSIHAKQWEWMKRYRVWEANRKVFLYPENWLEPELRDDQSPFFKEAMSELLQSDITEEKASIALLNYLAKLEEVAKLEPCGIHYVENDPGLADEIAHVVARTAGASRKYYYRRREYGYWTPWEQIKLDIEDEPVIPVVWNNRLFLFWLRILKQAPQTPPAAPPAGTDLDELDASTVIKRDIPKVTVQAVLCWSEYYNGKWQATRTSDLTNPLTLGKFDSFGTNAHDRSKLRLSAMFWTRGALRIIVSNEIGAGSSFFLHNAFSTPELRETKKDRHFAPKRILETQTNSLQVSYPGANVSHPVLTNGISHHTVEPHHPLTADPWEAPFFYEDSRHIFYVTTAEHTVRIPEWHDYGIAVEPSIQLEKPEIPPLVFEPIEVYPDPIGPITKQPGFGVTDPSPIEYFVTEDAYIDRGIATIGTVRYGDREIGPTGSTMSGVRNR